MKFDTIISNPPYHNKGNRRDPLWKKFVVKSIELTKENGFIASIHPPSWRRTNHKLQKMISKRRLYYLEMHKQEDGVITFGADTKYDWYILKNTNKTITTTIKTTDGKLENIDISKRNCIPNKNIEIIQSLMAKKNEEKCPVLFSYTKYDTRKPWMSETKDEEYRYPCIHMTRKSGDKIYYSSRKNKGMFGIPKIIFGDSLTSCGICNPFIDINGEYGQTQHAIAIEVDKSNVDDVYKAITSTKFVKEVIESIKWCGFQLDWRMFKYFRKDFYKDFI